MIKIGNWIVDQEGIKWDGSPKNDYSISKERLNVTGSGNRENMYDWLVHLPEKTWLTNEDVYALNTAFIYALEFFKIEKDPDVSIVATLEEQQKELEFK